MVWRLSGSGQGDGQGRAKAKKKLKNLHCTSRMFYMTTFACVSLKQKKSKYILPLTKRMQISAFKPPWPGRAWLNS